MFSEVTAEIAQVTKTCVILTLILLAPVRLPIRILVSACDADLGI